MSDAWWADEIMDRLRAKNVWTHPHHWQYDAARDVYVGIDPALNEVAGARVDSVRNSGDVAEREHDRRTDGS